MDQYETRSKQSNFYETQTQHVRPPVVSFSLPIIDPILSTEEEYGWERRQGRDSASIKSDGQTVKDFPSTDGATYSAVSSDNSGISSTYSDLNNDPSSSSADGQCVTTSSSENECSTTIGNDNLLDSISSSGSTSSSGDYFAKDDDYEEKLGDYCMSTCQTPCYFRWEKATVNAFSSLCHNF